MHKNSFMAFNLFGTKKLVDSISFTDITLITETAKAKALVAAAMRNTQSVFLAWFEETAAKYKTVFEDNGMDSNRIVEAKHFARGKYPNKEIIFLEHYPLRAKEMQLLQTAAPQKYIVYNALEEPLFQIFGGQRIIELVKKMGMADDEILEHNMISKSIQNAQEKIAEKVILERSARSQKEWLDLNVKM